MSTEIFYPAKSSTPSSGARAYRWSWVTVTGPDALDYLQRLTTVHVKWLGPGQGALVLEITAPRIPCATFAAHMGDANFVKVFRQMRRPGLYARVIQAGTVAAGDPVSVQHGSDTAPTVLEEFELYYAVSPSREQLERSLAAPIAIRTRQGHLERLGKI